MLATITSSCIKLYGAVNDAIEAFVLIKIQTIAGNKSSSLQMPGKLVEDLRRLA